MVLPHKTASLAEPQILVFRGSIVRCHPKEGGREGGSEGCSPTGFLEGIAIVQSASGPRSLTDGCSETWTLYRW